MWLTDDPSELIYHRLVKRDAPGMPTGCGSRLLFLVVVGGYPCCILMAEGPSEKGGSKGAMSPQYSVTGDQGVFLLFYCLTRSHRGPTESRFFARARATNGLGTFTGLLWKVLRGFKNISRGALGDNGH